MLRRSQTTIAVHTGEEKKVLARNTRDTLAKLLRNWANREEARHILRKRCPASRGKSCFRRTIWLRFTDMFVPPEACALRMSYRLVLDAYAHISGDSKRKASCRTSLFSENRSETHFL